MSLESEFINVYDRKDGFKTKIDHLKMMADNLSAVPNQNLNMENYLVRDSLLKILGEINAHLKECAFLQKSLHLSDLAADHISYHQFLPHLILEIFSVSRDQVLIVECVEILTSLIVKCQYNTDDTRREMRNQLSDSGSFHHLIDLLETITNSQTHVKLLKIIQCICLSKGSQTQTSLVTDQQLDFIKEMLNTYSNNAEMSSLLLTLIKVLCRSKNHCSYICCSSFLESFVNTVVLTKKFAIAVTILKFLAKNNNAVILLSKSSNIIDLILRILLLEKSTNKKHIISVLYNLSYHTNEISRHDNWLSLLQFIEGFAPMVQDLKSHHKIVKILTIIYRNLPREKIVLSKHPLDVKLSHFATKGRTVSPCSNTDQEDDDNNVEDDELESEIEVSDYDDSENEDDDEDVSDHESSRINRLFSTSPSVNINIENEAYLRIGEFYNELKEDEKSGSNNRPPFQKANIPPDFNYRAFPDLIPDDDIAESNTLQTVTISVNQYAVYDLTKKVQRDISLNGKHVQNKVYDLDLLLRVGHPEPDIPILSNFEDHNDNFAENFTLSFESRFESGNLRTAIQVDEFEYNLVVAPDLNMVDGMQWFYFQISNVYAKKSYTFNIINFMRVNSQFNYGLQPVMFSVKNYIRNGIGWVKHGRNVIYYGGNFSDHNTQKHLRTLSFTMEFPCDKDYCYIAYHFPYTYSKLMRVIESIIPDDSTQIYCKVDKLCSTISNANDAPLITITSSRNRDRIAIKSLQKRALVFITSRVHPGESNSSWIMDGVLRVLLDPHNSDAQAARDRYIFKIIPMLNIEGVIYGRYGVTGEDLNRCWKNPDQRLHPEIFFTKELVRYGCKVLNKEIRAFIDIHGHSRKKYFFLYGCDPNSSWLPSDNQLFNDNDEYKSLPRALSVNKHMKMEYCRFSVEKRLEATCRIVMWREFKIARSYTLECSYCSGHNKKKITTSMLQDIGASLVDSLTHIKTSNNN